MTRSTYQATFLTLLLSSFFLPALAFAQATLSISPASGTYRVGDSFSVLVDLDTAGKDINVTSAKINFDTSKLAVKSLGYSRSIFTLWTEEPKFSNSAGVISFSGGLPSPGYNGNSGSILRITFVTKAAGKTPVQFSTGYVLANNGTGTNILESLKGADFNITGSAISPTSGINDLNSSATTTAGSYESTAQAIPAPTLVLDSPNQIEEGNVVTVSGLAAPNSKVLLFIQGDSGEPVSEVDNTGPDGKFRHTYSMKPPAGIYRVWARNMVSEGVTSDSSQLISVAVIKTPAFNFGGMILSYLSIILILFSILFLMAFWLFFWWIKMRKRLREQGIEVSDAEMAMHDGFDHLRYGIQNYLGVSSDLKRLIKKETRVKQDLKADLKEMKKEIEKEMKDAD